MRVPGPGAYTELGRHLELPPWRPAFRLKPAGRLVSEMFGAAFGSWDASRFRKLKSFGGHGRVQDQGVRRASSSRMYVTLLPDILPKSLNPVLKPESRGVKALRMADSPRSRPRGPRCCLQPKWARRRWASGSGGSAEAFLKPPPQT